MDNTTIIGQGYFTASSAGLSNPNAGNATVSNSVAAYIQIPSNADWMMVRNWTQFGTAGNDGAYINGSATASTGLEYYWQRGMAAGSAIVKYYTDDTLTTISGDTIVSGGFTLYDPSGQSVGGQPLLGPAVAITAVTNVTRPVVTASNAGLSVGSVVRLSNTAQSDVNGIDMVVGSLTSTTAFTLLTATNALATAPGAIGGAGFYRIVYNANNALFYPRRRYVVNVTQAANAQVSTSVAHGLTAGQEIRFNIPAESGMVQLNPQSSNNYFPVAASNGVIVMSVVDDYNFTINIDTTAYTAFTWPTIAQQPSSFPTFTPLGEDTATALVSTGNLVPSIGGVPIFNANTGILADSTVNTGYLGMVLGVGGVGTVLTTTILGPSGSIAWSAGNVPTGDLMYWVAGKSTYGGL